MSMISIHAAAIDNKAATYHEFLTRYSKRKPVVYGFVEGKDDPCFYRSFIELLLPETWEVELWPAGNKNQVYKIHQDIDWRRFPKSRVCFFVDQDLSSIIPNRLMNDTNIYVTDGYSIENAIVNKGTCKRVLTELYGLAEAAHSEIDAVGEQFDEELEKFFEAMISPMAWIVFWQRAGLRANLNNVKMNDLFSLVDGRLVPKVKATDETELARVLHSWCGVSLDTSADITVAVADIRKRKAYRRFVRGKYALWFLIEFCTSVRMSAAKLFQGMKKPPKMHITISPANAIAVVATRARMPASLRRFVEKTFMIYITKNDRTT